MKEKLRQFMAGRYGTDQLGRFSMGAAILSYIIFMITRLSIFNIIFFVMILVYYFRAMSRNCSKRYEENLRFLQIKNRIFGRFSHSREHLEQRKIYRFYTCPGCRQKVRVPKGRGKIAITCPRCHAEFIRKS